MSGPLILVVEDESPIRRFVREALVSEGCRVLEAGSRDAGLLAAGEHRPELVVLDLGLPDGDGVEFVESFRAWSRAPVLVLSARSTEQDKIGVLDAGADDYLTKPFSVGELLARVRALLRRATTGGESGAARLEFGDLIVDFSRRQVLRQGAPVRLTPIEYRLLTVMVASAGKVLTHRQLLREVWGPAYSESSHYLRIYVGHLRHKLEADPAQPQHFLTETGVGYRFQL